MLPLLDVEYISYWTSLINLIVSVYFDEGSTTCILWNKDINFHLDLAQNQYVIIRTENLQNSLEHDIENLTIRQEELGRKGIFHDALIIKLTFAIDIGHCENFIVFQEDIPKFTKAFRKACSYAQWESQRSKFLFAYRKDIAIKNLTSYFDDILLRDQPNILVIEAENGSSHIFHLKTNKFVGPLSENPFELQTINTYNAITKKFEYPNVTLYADKIKDLQGREVILASFDYRPFVAFDENIQPQVKDYAVDNPSGSMHIDGIEVRILLQFCKLYNCTVQVDSTEKRLWGDVNENITGTGILGMIATGKAHIALGALYMWQTHHVDVTRFLGRSGITCLVPKPSRLTSWILPLKPFTTTLWACITICLITEMVLILVTYQLEQNLEAGDEHQSWTKSFFFGFQTALKTFVSQSPNVKVVSLSVRVVLFSCFMVDFILTTTYDAGLASILTIPTLAEAPDSLERLHKFRIPWTATAENWIFAFRNSNQTFYKDLITNFRIYTVDQLRELAKYEDMAFVVERTSYGYFGNVDYLTLEAMSRLKLMIDDIYYQHTVGVVSRLWPMLRKFNKLIINWQSSGFNKFWEWRSSFTYNSRMVQEQIRASNQKTSNTDPVKLDMKNFVGMILIWCLGILTSILAFFGEIYCYRKNGGRIRRV